MSKLSIVPNQTGTTDCPPIISDKELSEQIIILLEDNKRLRHELKNKRYAYELAMNINFRSQAKIKDLEETIKLNNLCNEVFSKHKLTKAA